jgi:hypothetical protein
MSNAQKEEDVFMEVEDVLNGEEFQEVLDAAFSCTVLHHCTSDSTVSSIAELQYRAKACAAAMLRQLCCRGSKCLDAVAVVCHAYTVSLCSI